MDQDQKVMLENNNKSGQLNLRLSLSKLLLNELHKEPIFEMKNSGLPKTNDY